MALLAPVTTTTAIITLSIATIRTSQRFSVRATSAAGTIPSGKGRCSGSWCVSANVASRQEEEKIEGKPSRQEQRDGDGGDHESAARAMPEGLLPRHPR